MSTLLISTDGTAKGTYISVDGRAITHKELSRLHIDVQWFAADLWHSVGTYIKRKQFAEVAIVPEDGTVP